MPVTHGVRGSSPLRTAKKDDRKVIFFLFIRERCRATLYHGDTRKKVGEIKK